MIPHALIALVVIICSARVLGLLFRGFGQPPVVGEMIAGIALGPSILGRVAPALAARLFAPETVSAISAIAQLGVILFMFLVGLEFDFDWLRRQSGSSAAVSQASIAAPFLLGSVLALWLYRPFCPAGFSRSEFSLFLGVSMSVTAFPVLARILRDFRLESTPLGVTALTSAAIGDACAWCLLALVLGVVQSEPGRILRTVACAVVFILGMFFAVRPVAARLARKSLVGFWSALPGALLALVGLAVSALATDRIGIHPLFGAFLFGVILPHDSSLARSLSFMLARPVRALLLPVFFAFTGLLTQIGLLHRLRDWALCSGILAVASLGKFGGSYIAARITGSQPRVAAALGILMNTRGLMELIVLNVGRKIGILSPPLFAMLVLMAVATTFATAPILKIMLRRTGMPAETTS